MRRGGEVLLCAPRGRKGHGRTTRQNRPRPSGKKWTRRSIEADLLQFGPSETIKRAGTFICSCLCVCVWMCIVCVCSKQTHWQTEQFKPPSCYPPLPFPLPLSLSVCAHIKYVEKYKARNSSSTTRIKWNKKEIIKQYKYKGVLHWASSTSRYSVLFIFLSTYFYNVNKSQSTSRQWIYNLKLKIKLCIKKYLNILNFYFNFSIIKYISRV